MGSCTQMTSFPVAPGTEANSFVWASNRDYAFQLWTKDPSKGWAVKEIRLNQKDLDAFDEKNLKTLKYGVDRLLRIDGTFLPDLIGRPYFEAIRAGSVILEGREFVELEFKAVHDPKDRDVTVQSGTLVLDPANCWCVRHANLAGLWTVPLDAAKVFASTTVVENIYRSENGIPIPESVSETNSWPHGKVEFAFKGKVQSQSWEAGDYESKIDYKLSLTSVSADDFYLTAFGLPEPKGMPAREKPTPWHWWLFIAGFAALAIGYLASRGTGPRTATAYSANRVFGIAILRMNRFIATSSPWRACRRVAGFERRGVIQ